MNVLKFWRWVVVMEVPFYQYYEQFLCCRGKESIIVYACDCSTEALERAKEMIDATNELSVKHRFHPFHCDFSISGFPQWLACNLCQEFFSQKLPICISDVNDSSSTDLNDLSSSKENNCCIGGVDFVTLIFTLSAVPLHRMPTAIASCFSVLNPGGLLLFRDYGLYDMTMLRFEPDKRVGFREYMRSDGTRSYYFSLDSVRDIFMSAGFTELELEYCCVRSVNRRNGKSMQRVWVHGKFQKPM
uniref:Putative methyltransferase-like protein 6 n=1 Tax=Davidia involucrata TaxID=16924 RepID=A0A5B7BWP1_DAVIN